MMMEEEDKKEIKAQAPAKPKIKFQAPTGMHDVLGEDMLYFEKVKDVIDDIAEFYGFQKIDTPILEDAQVFEKSTGTSSDIVEKEMYTLKTKGGDVLCLRPEFTPGVVRAYLQNGMWVHPKPVKLYSFGPLFRYEKPQAGRYRQFNQFNFEMFGSKDPAVDAQLIQMFWAILGELKFKNLVVEINSIGCTECRPNFRKALVRFLKSKENLLSSDSKERLKKNPLRVLDSKDQRDKEIIANAPQAIDYLCDDCKAHFKKVIEYLDEIALPYKLNPYLVRGLDYYTKTVFEIYEDKGEQGSTSTLIGGGRYDTLIKSVGGQDTPALGGAGGVERIIEKLKERAKEPPKPKHQAHVFLAPLGEVAKKKALGLFEQFRQENIRCIEAFSKDALKAQLGIADKFGVDYALILGQREVLDGTIIIRNMKTAKQETVKLAKVVQEVKKRLKK
jgi:histidyl-tRNA synthetase